MSVAADLGLNKEWGVMSEVKKPKMFFGQRVTEEQSMKTAEIEKWEEK